MAAGRGVSRFGEVVILVAAVGIACGKAATPTAPSSSLVQTSGFFTSGQVQLSYRLDVPAHSAPVPAVVFGGLHGFDPKPVLESFNVPGLWLLGGEDRSIPTPATVAILDQLIASGKPYTHVVFPGVGHNLPPSWPDIDQWLAKIGK